VRRLAIPRSGLAGARTSIPASCSHVITPDQPDASANAPCTSNTTGVLPLTNVRMSAPYAAAARLRVRQMTVR
jgi:hypothetical protein